MARPQRLFIRQRPEPPQTVPISFAPDPETPFAFLYHGVRVLCSPIRQSGVIVALAFSCPRCATRQEMGDENLVTVMRNGLVHAGGIIECENYPSCHLRIEIIEGRAIDLWMD